MSEEVSSPKAARVSRETAVARFLEAIITLMDTRAVTDISVQEISKEVGLNHGYVSRYFGTRIGLFIAATDELADRILTLIQSETERKQVQGEPKIPADLSLIAATRPLTMKRMTIIQYLTSSGVPPDRFGPRTRAITETTVQALLEQGMSRKMAQSQAVKISILLWAQNALADSFGVSPEEVTDLLFVTIDEVLNTAASEIRLGWK
jgi:AcrR family transcriptional regulator